MPCFSCGQTFKGNVNDVLQRFKRDYLQRGIERYFYKLETNGDIKVIKKEQFSYIFKTQIQPNFDKGAEYAHISEYQAN
jgi:hypothetical protein